MLKKFLILYFDFFAFQKTNQTFWMKARVASQQQTLFHNKTSFNEGFIYFIVFISAFFYQENHSGLLLIKNTILNVACSIALKKQLRNNLKF